ncbi:MAG: hypothetical protein C0522_12120, partial [Rhodocyclaceae bacterium]|nr:hypothetical protein [Rhodocyclaceae bacterium]
MTQIKKALYQIVGNQIIMEKNLPMLSSFRRRSRQGFLRRRTMAVSVQATETGTGIRHRPVEELDSVVIRFVGDSGD